MTAIAPDETAPRLWAPSAVRVLAVSALIPGIGIAFGVASVLTAMYVFARRMYTPHEKLTSGLWLLLAVPASLLWLLALSISWI